MSTLPTDFRQQPVLDLFRGGRQATWLWLLVSLALIAGVGYLRLVVYSDQFAPLTSALALLVCLWHRDVRLLWFMALTFSAMVVYKIAALVPASEVSHLDQRLFGLMQMSNTLIAAAVIHGVIRLTNRLENAVSLLEQTNAELEASNEELAAREEEITQQNEELQSQTEELEQQTEELNTQTEELQTLNEQLVARERTLSDLLESSAVGAGEEETFERLGATIQRLFGERACAAAVLEAHGTEMSIHGLSGLQRTSKRIARAATLAALVLKRSRVGCLPNVELRPDLEVPRMANGSQVRSLAAAPIRAGGVIEGALEVYSDEPGDWSEHELRVVQWLADQCGLMLTAARLNDERERLLEAERTARAGAEHANRMKDEFVATLSHELRTPLNAVLGWAALLKRNNCSDAEEVMKGVEVIERNARHQGQLISDLLDISRIMAGKIRLDVQAVDLPLIIENALDSVKLAADSKRVHLARSVEPIESELIGDPSRIEQIVWNLLTNAIKFTPNDGHVQVAVSRVASYVQITVSDTGQGIDADLLPHLFDRYRQADGSATRRHGGLGLGLAIVKSLVELHGGTVHAQSDGPGTGATFTVLLPVRAERPGIDNPSRRGPTLDVPVAFDADVLKLSDLSILVVDDEKDARDLVGHILRDRGATVQTASSGEHVLNLLNNSDENKPDIIISDIGMPEMDGYSLMRTIRTSMPHSVRQIPAIALTAFARSEDRTRALLAGFQSHIPKPVEAAELVATVVSLQYAITAGRDGHVEVDGVD